MNSLTSRRNKMVFKTATKARSTVRQVRRWRVVAISVILADLQKNHTKRG